MLLPYIPTDHAQTRQETSLKLLIGLYFFIIIANVTLLHPIGFKDKGYFVCSKFYLNDIICKIIHIISVFYRQYFPVKL